MVRSVIHKRDIDVPILTFVKLAAVVFCICVLYMLLYVVVFIVLFLFFLVIYSFIIIPYLPFVANRRVRKK